MSDSATVSESILSFSTMNLSVCCAVTTGRPVLTSHQFIRFPLLRRPSFINIPFLSSLLSKLLQQVSLFFDAAQVASSEEIDFHVWFSPGFSDAVEASTSGVLSLHRETKCIIGFDFAVTLSSPESFCVLFRHHLRTICRTEMANVEQIQKMIPFITCEVSLGQYVCELGFRCQCI